MLIELAIGDAYGAGFEYAPARRVRVQNDLSGYMQHPRHGIRPGCYTDDTQMSIAIAEAIISSAQGPWTTPWQGRVGPKGMMSVRATLTAVVTHHRLSELLKACIAFTGDVDTVATIALAAASCSEEYEHDLPEPLIAGLEQGPYGYAYLKQLDQTLLPAR